MHNIKYIVGMWYLKILDKLKKNFIRYNKWLYELRKLIKQLFKVSRR